MTELMGKCNLRDEQGDPLLVVLQCDYTRIQALSLCASHRRERAVITAYPSLVGCEETS